MATSLLALIDDITSVLDDVALLSKVAAKKTAGVLGDDLALNAQQVSGVNADRELPVVWAVAKGSFVNKAILVPAALTISAFAPWAVTPLLMVGGVFLCYEGFEKLAHRYLQGDDGHAGQGPPATEPAESPADLSALEKTKIKGAIRTDFILSAEIIAITLGTVQGSPFMTQLAVLSSIAVAMTVGVYGLVAGIVKLDDGGLYLTRRTGAGGWRRFQRSVGQAILLAAPWLMKALSVAGTAAMFLVGGGIVVHGLAPLDHFADTLTLWLGKQGGIGQWLGLAAPLFVDALIGLLAGALALAAVRLFKRLRRGPSAAH